MTFTQPTLHHILYIESDSVQIAKHGFLNSKPKSIWIELDDDNQQEVIRRRLADLHKTGRIKLFLVSALLDGQESDLPSLQEELDHLERFA